MMIHNSILRELDCQQKIINTAWKYKKIILSLVKKYPDIQIQGFSANNQMRFASKNIASLAQSFETHSSCSVGFSGTCDHAIKAGTPYYGFCDKYCISLRYNDPEFEEIIIYYPRKIAIGSYDPAARGVVFWFNWRHILQSYGITQQEIFDKVAAKLSVDAAIHDYSNHGCAAGRY